MQRLQNKGLKLATGRDKFYPTKELHKECGLAAWEQRSMIALNRLMYKYKYSEDFVSQSLNPTRAYDGPIFKMDKPNSDQYARSVSYGARKLWNELPFFLCCIDDANTFRVLIRAHYYNSYFG